MRRVRWVWRDGTGRSSHLFLKSRGGADGPSPDADTEVEVHDARAGIEPAPSTCEGVVRARGLLLRRLRAGSSGGLQRAAGKVERRAANDSREHCPFLRRRGMCSRNRKLRLSSPSAKRASQFARTTRSDRCWVLPGENSITAQFRPGQNRISCPLAGQRAVTIGRRLRAVTSGRRLRVVTSGRRLRAVTSGRRLRAVTSGRRGGGCEGAKHGVFSCTQQVGAKNSKGVESDSVREQKMKCWWGKE